MTGEITLTGQVLPIGGLKEKALAAQRAGINRVISPAPQRARHRRRHPRHLRKRMEFVLVDNVDEVGPGAPRSKAPRARSRAARPG